MSLRKLILQNKETKSIFSEILVILISFCTIFNFMYIENLYFAETAIMSLAVYLSIIGAQKLIIRDTKNILKSLIYLIIATFCYNGIISVFIATVAFLLILKKEVDIKNNVTTIINGIIFCIIAVALNLIQIKIVCSFLQLTQNRINGIESMAFNITYIILYWWRVLIETAGLFPKFLFITFIVSFFCICFFSRKKTNKLLITQMYLFSLFSIISSFAIYLFTLSSFGSGRLHTNIGMLLGYLFTVVYVKTNIFEVKNICKYCMSVLLFMYLIINIFNIRIITQNHKDINEIEKMAAYEIGNYIENYEKVNNIKVKYIAMRYVAEKKEKGFYKRQTTVNCIGIYDEPSFDGIINFYTDNNLQRISLTDNINNEFIKLSEQNNKTFQCIGNVLVCEVYIV